MRRDHDSEGLGSTEPPSDASLPTWSGRKVEAGQSDEIIDASLWLEAVGDVDPTQSSARANAASAQAGTSPPSTVDGERSRRRRRAALMLLGAAAALTLAGLAGWALGQGSSSSVETAGVAGEIGSSGETGETAAGGDGLVAEAELSAETSAATPGRGVTTQTSAQTTVDEAPEPFVVPETADNPSGATQYAVMADGKAVMRGWYPTEEQARTAVADAAAIMGGMENVTDETQVDPRAEIRPDSFAVYLQDFILFEFDSAEITPEFYEFLGFPLFFMQNNPVASVTVVARTDARGSESYNLDLATRRAEAVRDHWLANGGNADQIILDPRGEQDADESADGELAALDRRVELRVSGFLAG